MSELQIDTAANGETRSLAGGASSAAADCPEIEELKRHFLASLNHEVRTPLTGILGMAELLLETELNVEQLEYVTTARRCAQELLEVLNAALDFSALSAGAMVIEAAEFPLQETIRSAVLAHMMTAESKGIRLYCSLAEGLPEVVIGDGVRLRQLISYLVSNGVKFTHEGEVEVSASGEICDGTLHLTLRVRDTGIGIPAEKIESVFRSFHQLEGGLTRSYPGLGLGLALARRTAQLLGGNVQVASQVGQGSEFWFQIPLEMPREVPRPVAAIANAAFRILVVDDDPVSRQIARRALESAGQHVDTVDSAQAALRAMDGTLYDAVLLDMQMPDLDGLETAQAIRQRTNGHAPPLIAFTANADDVSRITCREHGFAAFISKPVQIDELRCVVDRILRPS